MRPVAHGLLTGRHPVDIGAWDNSAWLPSDVPTFADALSCTGYETVLCGRMHFSGSDQLHGFTHRLHGDCSGFVSPEIIGDGFNKTAGQTKYAVEVSSHGRIGYEHFDGAVTDRAVEFLTERRPSEDPFCLVVGYILPHNPLICFRELFDYYHDRIEPPPPPPDDYLEALSPAIRK